MVESMMLELANAEDDSDLKKLLALVELHFVPMLNPDGVIIGNSTVNLGGLDMDRKWVENDAEICREVHYF
jgi:murein tripeptide amidase MpaA